MTEITPRIYVASLSDYNSGRLHGEWIEAIHGKDDILEQIQEMLDASPSEDAEEWAIHDHDGFGGISIGEYMSLDTVAELGELIQEYGTMIAGVVDQYGLDYLDEVRDAVENRYLGSADSLVDWAAELLDEQLAQVPERLRGYFDYESYARDLELGGDVFVVEADGLVHVFSAG